MKSQPEETRNTSGAGQFLDQNPPVQAIEHYENFPVASWLCPPRLRPAVAAIYHFARTADDLADEGDTTAEQRLADLAQYRADLTRTVAGNPHRSTRWPGVFSALSQALSGHHLPPQPLHDLLSAFEQDVRYTAEGRRYQDMEELLAYCRLSANPVGRLLLHLQGIDDELALAQSDAICSALQLINFWQDLSVDLPRHRHYLPRDMVLRFGVDEAALLLPLDKASPAHEHHAAEMVVELVEYARALMLQGAPLTRRMPGRMGWELRLVVQGGLRILDKIEALGCATWRQRPRIQSRDLPLMAWRALVMKHSGASR